MVLDRSRLLIHISSLIMTLVVMGSAIAMWSYSLKIKTIINTGEVDVEFGYVETYDPPGYNDPGYDKDVATCYADKIEMRMRIQIILPGIMIWI